MPFEETQIINIDYINIGLHKNIDKMNSLYRVYVLMANSE